jgi:gluconate 2-dehydrogenase gamma chain
MAGQGVARRELMRLMAMGALASTFTGFERWSFACADTHPGAPPAASAKSAYQPQFFTGEEFRLVDCLAELIIPADQHPGAHAAGVAEFIDFMVANGANLADGGVTAEQLQPKFRSGLSWTNERAKSLYVKPFLECAEPQQTELLQHLAYRKQFRAGEEAGQQFFQLMRDYTVKGYYSSRIGLEALDFPGLQTVWAAMPGCPHTNDPEHNHLPPPVV